MKFLHTSDWHIGAVLHGRRRISEHRAFLEFLTEVIRRDGIDVLLISGDVFDTAAPSVQAQELYYDFLCHAGCRHIIVTAGNHDSPSFLDAPKALLNHLNVHVVGVPTEDLRDEVIVPDSAAAVCAVPFLRDRDLRTARLADDASDAAAKNREGIKKHYAGVLDAARTKAPGLPVVAMGHLFAAGAKTTENDELFVGSLAACGADCFPDEFRYVALGHLHIPQKVAGLETRRYCGSPLPMSFSEAGQKKILLEFELNGRGVSGLSEVEVPCFHRYERLAGTVDELTAGLRELGKSGEPVSVFAEYTGKEFVTELCTRLNAAVAGTNVEILRISNPCVYDQILRRGVNAEKLENLSVLEVFERCMEAKKVPEAERPAFREAYRELLERNS